MTTTMLEVKWVSSIKHPSLISIASICLNAHVWRKISSWRQLLTVKLEDNVWRTWLHSVHQPKRLHTILAWAHSMDDDALCAQKRCPGLWWALYLFMICPCQYLLTVYRQCRANHILQCTRKSLNAAPYQQRYKNGKRAHRWAHRSFLQFCYLCAQWFYNEEQWTQHCQNHLRHLHPRCGLLTFRSTLVAPGFCPFCLGDKTKEPDERFQQWLKKTTLLYIL